VVDTRRCAVRWRDQDEAILAERSHHAEYPYSIGCFRGTPAVLARQIS
jgi:hypothetical protein